MITLQYRNLTTTILFLCTWHILLPLGQRMLMRDFVTMYTIEEGISRRRPNSLQLFLDQLLVSSECNWCLHVQGNSFTCLWTSNRVFPMLMLSSTYIARINICAGDFSIGSVGRCLNIVFGACWSIQRFNPPLCSFHSSRMSNLVHVTDSGTHLLCCSVGRWAWTKYDVITIPVLASRKCCFGWGGYKRYLPANVPVPESRRCWAGR
jgi:hypothetical protein